MQRSIVVRGARQNNLKGIDVEIPHRSLTVVTGPSGSGKSSLAFDTVYAEGQRRYVESLSTYAKQFLERMPKPSVERIDGICPSVAIDQRNSVRSSRSTVGTVTETADYLRLLWSRIGRTVCPDCGEAVVPDTAGSAADFALSLPDGSLVYVAFPIGIPVATAAVDVLDNLRAEGFVRVLVDRAEWHLDDAEQDLEHLAGKLTGATELLVVVDRLVVGSAERERLTSALATAFAGGHGRAVVVRVSPDVSTSGERQFESRLNFSELFQCRKCGRSFSRPTPLLFSFNHPTGACGTCNGFGATLEYDESLIVPDPERSLADGALDPWTKPRYRKERAALLAYASDSGIKADEPWEQLPVDVRKGLLNGAPGFKGVVPFLRSRERKRYKQYIRVFLRSYQLPTTCPDCKGGRLRPEALAVKIQGQSIAEVSALTMSELSEWLNNLELQPFESGVSATIREEISDRVGFLVDVGVGYLTPDRQARTLSGGEMQRIRLAGSLGSRLVDTLYVLDEPTIGLHARDVERFMVVLMELRNRGNTVLVVEHERFVIEAADRVIELGPGAGEVGGEVVFAGSVDELLSSGTTTGRALTAPRSFRRSPRTPLTWLTLEGAELHNLHAVDLRIPVGCLSVVTGVSGSGKSTLVHQVLYRALERELAGASTARRHLGESTGAYRKLHGAEQFEDVVLVDQSPIGRTSRSNPVTYIKAYDAIRKFFAELPESRRREYEPKHFSFNVAGGRCEACKGAGEETIEMVFLADVAIPCEVCLGARFRPEILEVEHRGLNIRDVLELTVDEAIRFFIRQDRLGEALWQLQRVGLGYLRLGQPATTLSGGEAQRLKIARELARASGASRLYLLDEPTVGLGAGEVDRLVDVLHQLVEAGGTVVVVEHNLDLIAAADWVVDLGPEASEAGGRIVAEGPPESIMATSSSHTGHFLRRWLKGARIGGAIPSATGAA
ncbi:MAG: excinuclease ABC subunit A [Gemmatimonadales bacterium]|nr:MAG: excinuclease ABC subunit A [Gemmatimonadales bacterium]